MTLLARKHPVQLLHDARGIYGIGVVGCEVEEDRGEPPEIILRPDRLLEAGTRAAALQMITGGFRPPDVQPHGWRNASVRQIHWEMLRRKGLNWPPYRLKWWSDDAQQQARNRQIYHGLRLKSLTIINRLVGEALQAAAEPDALALARRFQFYDRYEIYRATAVSRRALQLVNVFPALGLSGFGRVPWRECDFSSGSQATCRRRRAPAENRRIDGRPNRVSERETRRRSFGAGRRRRV